MDPLFQLLLDEAESEAETELKTRGKKKKSASYYIKKAQQKLAEEARQNLIKQRQEKLKQTKLRMQGEWERNHAKAEKYESEFQSRYEKLVQSYIRLGEFESAWKELQQEKKKYDEWVEYKNCNRLPKPSSMPEINRYIFEWTELESGTDMNYCIKKTEEVLTLLNGVEEVINNPMEDYGPTYVNYLKELRNRVRDLLQENIDKAIFHLFSRLETDMESINVTTSKYFAECPYFKISLWAELYTPYSSTGKDAMAPLKLHLEDVDVYVTVPPTLLLVHKVMRVIWFKYDHWSDKCRTYDCPPCPSYYNLNMLELFLTENDLKKEIMNTRNNQERKIKEKLAEMPPEPTLSQAILVWSSEPQRALSEEITYRECEEEDNLGKQILAKLNEYEVNLRQRSFLGDLLLLELLRVPPQPKYLRYKHNVTLREEPPRLRPVDYYVKFPPAVEEEPEEEEGTPGIRRHVREEKSHNEEEEKKKLVTIKIKPVSRIIWFEKPLVARWDSVNGYWTAEDIHDVTHDDETGYLTFKSGRLGLFGLHVNRYCLFPYEDWVFERSKEGEVDFYLKTSKADLNFKIKEDKVCLAKMTEISNNPMQWIIGKYYTPKKLKEFLQKGGINVFPEPDASPYVKGVTPKHIVVEDNIYQIWGLFSGTFRFKKSKFNQGTGRGKFVFQAQEIYDKHQVEYCLIQTELCNCYVLDIYEDSETYSPHPAPYMNPAIDLFTLLYKNCTLTARKNADAANFILVQTVQEFLNLTRPLSFS